MYVNRQYSSAMWGYALMICLLIALTFALLLSQTPIAMAQEPEPTPGRSQPGPVRPQPGPPRSTPPPPTAPPAPAPPPSDDSKSHTESTPQPTATARPPMMPTTGGTVGAGGMLLRAGIASAVAGVSVNVIDHRRSRQRGSR